MQTSFINLHKSTIRICKVLGEALHLSARQTNLFSALFSLRVKEGPPVLPDGQIRFSTNRKWHAAMSFVPKPRDIPRYQYPVILISSAIAAVYFCILREENELDRILAGEVTVFDKAKPI